MHTRYAATFALLFTLVSANGPSYAAGGGEGVGDPVIILSNRAAERAASVSPTIPPVLDQPVNMTVAEGTTAEQLLSASDGEGQPLHFFKLDGPAYLWVSTLSAGSGEAVGRLRLQPAFDDSGTAQAIVGVSDGIAGDWKSFTVSVANVDRPLSSHLEFEVPVHYPTATEPGQIAIGDLNGDGKVDLVLGHVTSGMVSVFLGKGDGTFQLKGTFPGGRYGGWVVVADLSGDGIPDVAIPTTNWMSILPGKGDGTLGAPVPIPLSTTGIPAAGDLNEDRLTDLVVCNYEAGTVNILISNGDGTFRPPLSYPVGRYPVGARILDVSQDGILDLVVATHTSSVSVLLGNGDGSFMPQPAYVANQNPDGFAVGDMNSDGFPDIPTA